MGTELRPPFRNPFERGLGRDVGGTSQEKPAVTDWSAGCRLPPRIAKGLQHRAPMPLPEAPWVGAQADVVNRIDEARGFHER